VGKKPHVPAAHQPARVSTVHRSFLLPCAPSSLRVVRRAAGADLRRAGVPEHLRHDVLLVLCELLANAIRHASPLVDDGIRVGWRVGAKAVEVEVTDGGAPTMPTAGRPEAMALSGRGLAMVQELSGDWGVERGADGQQRVWAVLHRHHGASAAGG